MAEPAGCTDSKWSEHRQQTPGDKSASAGPVFVPKCSQHDRSLPCSWIHPECKSYTTSPFARTHSDQASKPARDGDCGSPVSGSNSLCQAANATSLAWTEKPHLLALDKHDLPKAIGFVECDRRYVLTRFVEHFGAIAHRNPSPSLRHSTFSPNPRWRRHGGTILQDGTRGNNRMLIAVLGWLADWMSLYISFGWLPVFRQVRRLHGP